MDPRVLMLGCVCVVGATAVMAIPRSSGIDLIAQANAIKQAARPEPEAAPADTLSLPVPAATRLSMSEPAARRVPSEKLQPAARIEPPASIEPAAPRPLTPTAVAATRALSNAPELTASATSEPAHEIEGSIVTIAGCLERNDDSFRLKDTAGDAPQKRSWRSGFLRKRSASIDLIESGRTPRLPAYVGQRIETTGVLVDREMQVRSLRVLGSCES